MDYLKMRIKKAGNKWYDPVFSLLPSFFLNIKWSQYVKIEEREETSGGRKGTVKELFISASLYQRLTSNQIKAYVKEQAGFDKSDQKNVWAADEFLATEVDCAVQKAENMLLMMPELVHSVQVAKGIRNKILHLVIVDSGDWLTEFAVRSLYQELNYLSIVTKRSEVFEMVIDEIYEETGLLIQCSQHMPLYQKEGQIILDLDQEGLTELQGYEAVAVICLYEKAGLDQLETDLIRSFELSSDHVFIEFDYLESWKVARNISGIFRGEKEIDREIMHSLSEIKKEYNFAIRRLK